jgi:hypothetical protein
VKGISKGLAMKKTLGQIERGIERRDFLKSGGAALATALLAGWPRGRAWGDESPAMAPIRKPLTAKAKTVILVYLAGGLPQTETFDPKPENGKDNGDRKSVG